MPVEIQADEPDFLSQARAVVDGEFAAALAWTKALPGATFDRIGRCWLVSLSVADLVARAEADGMMIRLNSWAGEVYRASKEKTTTDDNGRLQQIYDAALTAYTQYSGPSNPDAESAADEPRYQAAVTAAQAAGATLVEARQQANEAMIDQVGVEVLAELRAEGFPDLPDEQTIGLTCARCGKELVDDETRVVLLCGPNDGPCIWVA